jgi:pimeloyl-ACP methyl ester carboxylesterase
VTAARTYASTLLSNLQQIRRSWYILFFQLPFLPEAGMRANNWRGLARTLRRSGKTYTFSAEEIQSYKEAWSRPGAIKAMVNWYRAIIRYQPALRGDLRIRVPTLMLWGMKDFALSDRMAQPSIDYCDDGRLILFPDATHWVQRDVADDVNRLLLDFVLDRPG